MDPQLVMMSMQTCQEYAGKSAATPLTEDEVLCYNQILNTVKVHMRLAEIHLSRMLIQEEAKENQEGG